MPEDRRISMPSRDQEMDGGVDDGAERSEESIYRLMHAAIAERRLPAGVRLVEDQLARLFCVSRARIRSVLQILARERMVTLQKNRGAFVSYPSVAEAREVFEARRLLERTLILEVAKTLDAAARQRLDGHIAEEAAAAATGDRRTAIRLSGEFHLLLAALLGNATLSSYLTELIARSSLVIAIYEGANAHDCGVEEHRQIAAALAAGSGAEAARLMEAHLAGVEARLSLDAGPEGGKLDFKAILDL